MRIFQISCIAIMAVCLVGTIIFTGATIELQANSCGPFNTAAIWLSDSVFGPEPHYCPKAHTNG
jgi:hypothetical protein